MNKQIMSLGRTECGSTRDVRHRDHQFGDVAYGHRWHGGREDKLELNPRLDRQPVELTHVIQPLRDELKFHIYRYFRNTKWLHIIKEKASDKHGQKRACVKP